MSQNEQNVRTREAFSGYLFHSPDTGTEWNISHPIESGECVDATDIQHATFARLISHLQEAWQAIAEREAERNREILEAEARGAAEQRRKDAERQELVAWVDAEDLPSTECQRKPTHLIAKRTAIYSTPLYTRPANVAALEAEIAELRQFLADLLATESRPDPSRPCIIDLCFTAFMRRVVGKNPEDGGPCDWFNDTRPQIIEQIDKLRGALTREGGV